jgi:hypothetical protein
MCLRSQIDSQILDRDYDLPGSDGFTRFDQSFSLFLMKSVPLRISDQPEVDCHRLRLSPFRLALLHHNLRGVLIEMARKSCTLRVSVTIFPEPWTLPPKSASRFHQLIRLPS